MIIEKEKQLIKDSGKRTNEPLARINIKLGDRVLKTVTSLCQWLMWQ